MSSNITRTVGPNGEIITILPIEIKFDRSTGGYYAVDENSGKEYSLLELERLADTGDPSAQCAMGDYFNIKETPQLNFHDAYEWYRKAAAQNHAKALHVLGLFYAMGIVVGKDFDKACARLEESAKHGFLEAMFHLGGVYMMKDIYDKSIFWLDKADRLGHPEAREQLEMIKLLAKGAENIPGARAAHEKQSREYWET